MESLARESGVHDLYRHAVSAFGGCLQRHTTRSTIAFGAHLDGSRKVIISLLPGESSAADGLGYQLYKHRFATLSGLSAGKVEGQLPESHDHWAYSSTGGPDWEGFQGYIKTPAEIDRLAASLSSSRGVA